MISVIGNIGALGAGDFGADGLSEVCKLFAEWARSDKGQKILMTAGSVIKIIGGIALAAGAGIIGKVAGSAITFVNKIIADVSSAVMGAEVGGS